MTKEQIFQAGNDAFMQFQQIDFKLLPEEDWIAIPVIISAIGLSVAQRSIELANFASDLMASKVTSDLPELKNHLEYEIAEEIVSNEKFLYKVETIANRIFNNVIFKTQFEEDLSEYIMFVTPKAEIFQEINYN